MEADCMTQRQANLFFYENRINEKNKEKPEKNNSNSGYLIITMYIFNSLVFKSRIRKNEGLLSNILKPYTIFFLTYFVTMLSTLTYGFVTYKIAETDSFMQLM